MKGLLRKDIALLSSNKTSLPIFLLIAVMMLITGDVETGNVVVPYFTMLCGILSISTISYDEVDHSNAFLLTLPVTRVLYVAEKYVLIWIAVMTGWLVSWGGASAYFIFRGYELVWTEWILSSFIAAMVLFLILCLMLPVQLKFGATNSRIARIALLAIVMVVVYAGKRIGEMMHIDWVQWIHIVYRMVENITTFGLVTGMIVMIIALLGISFRISVRIMRKKQF